MDLKPVIKRLATYNANGFPITSLYLDIDRRSFTPLKTAEVAHQLVRYARTELISTLASTAARESAQRDLEKFTQLVGAELDQSSARGLALFSCSEMGLWEKILLPIQTSTAISISRHARLRPLARMADDLAPYLVVLVDREKARFFLADLGGIAELEGFVDDVPGRVRVGTHYGLADARIERHIDQQIRRHLKRVAAEIAALVDQRSVARVVIGGTPEAVTQVQLLLPTEIAERVAGVMDELMIIARPDEVLKQSAQVIAEFERAEEKRVAAAIADTSGPGRRGVAGVEDTLDALYARAVHTLAVDDTMTVGGWRCIACGRLQTRSRTCGECGGDSIWMDDLADEAIRQAVCQDADIEVVSDESARRRLNGMGAILHFAVPRMETPMLAR